MNKGQEALLYMGPVTEVGIRTDMGGFFYSLRKIAFGKIAKFDQLWADMLDFNLKEPQVQS